MSTYIPWNVVCTPAANIIRYYSNLRELVLRVVEEALVLEETTVVDVIQWLVGRPEDIDVAPVVPCSQGRESTRRLTWINTYFGTARHIRNHYRTIVGAETARILACVQVFQVHLPENTAPLHLDNTAACGVVQTQEDDFPEGFTTRQLSLLGLDSSTRYNDRKTINAVWYGMVRCGMIHHPSRKSVERCVYYHA